MDNAGNWAAPTWTLSIEGRKNVMEVDLSSFKSSSLHLSKVPA